MAATCIGLSTVAFGLASETGVVVQNFTSTETSETTELSAHNGTFAAVAFSNRKQNISLSGNCNDSKGAVLERAFGKGVRESSYAAAGQEDFAKYDGWLEAQGLSAGLKETERKIAEIQRGDFAVV